METVTQTLTDFLLARIAEDERDAGRMPSEPDGYATHWDCWDMERVLAECEAKRRIVERHVSSADTRGVGQHRDGKWTPYCEHDSESWPCPDIADLASIYADYRDEWRP